MKKQLPPPTPPYTGGEPNARNRFNITMKRILPLCKGELEGVVSEEHKKRAPHDALSYIKILNLTFSRLLSPDH